MQLSAIKNLGDLATYLDVSATELSKMIFSSSAFYKTFQIPKKKGGKREISTPKEPLKKIQRKIYRKLLEPFAPHECAHAYARNKSTLTNAHKHIESKFMYKMDITDFFGSITYQSVLEIFLKIREAFESRGDEIKREERFSKLVAIYLSRLCTLDGKLPQGAPTSPHLSNLVAYTLDQKLEKLSQKNGVCYSRYSDDMVFSSKDRIDKNFRKLVKNILFPAGFDPNPFKSARLSPKDNKIVTGILIKSGQLRLPRCRRREFRAEYHNLIKIIKNSDVQSYDTQKQKFRVIGKLRYWLFIEPDNHYALDAIKSLQHI